MICSFPKFARLLKYFSLRFNFPTLIYGRFTPTHTLFHNFTGHCVYYFPGDFNRKPQVFFLNRSGCSYPKKIFVLVQKKVDTMDHFLIQKTPAQLRLGISETIRSGHARGSVSRRQDFYSTAHTTLLRYHWLLQKTTENSGNE